MRNYSAGIGDPYWYEWSIGLLYALDMLNPDNEILHTILQANEMQGLDDVVIAYKDGTAKCIQIKHTRTNDTLSFSDLITPGEGGSTSILREMAQDWKNAKYTQGYSECKAVLLSNRLTANGRKSVYNRGTPTEYEYPALKNFIKWLNNALPSVKKVSDIELPEGWETAWDHFIEQINLLGTDVLPFLSNLVVLADQPSLDETIVSIQEKLVSLFKTDMAVSQRLDRNLCAALRTWATSLRAKQEITREDLLAALSLSDDKCSGDHDLSPCEPFFTSRQVFLGKLENNLKERTAPVIFLEGEPGSGKTNVVSKLANRSDSVITLRFHAFKPITPESQYISSDSGISSVEQFWGDLLIQLRHLFTGRLAEYNVPINNGLLSNDKLRFEVLRLAQAYAELRGKATIIAIDGIDHAARVGSDNTFLSSLIAPETIPDNVCFFIIGQPLKDYTAYPYWLASSPNVLRLSMPAITLDDITQLLQHESISCTDSSTEQIARAIYQVTGGNTLSTVFAVFECKRYSTITELADRLSETALSSGILAYYEYIWRSAAKRIPTPYAYVDNIIAVVLSVIPKRITASVLMGILADCTCDKYAWERVLDALYPIVIKEATGYRVFHNDVRIYLESLMAYSKDQYVDICEKIASYFLSQSEDLELKHTLGIDLLHQIGCSEEILKSLTYGYILEAIRIRRPMNEILAQIEMGLYSLTTETSFDDFLSFTCAVQTLYQYQKSLQWENEIHPEEQELPIFLDSEKKIVPREFFNESNIFQLFSDAEVLIKHDESERARYMLQRWLHDIPPYDLISTIACNLGEEFNDDFIANERTKQLLRQWGILCRKLKNKFTLPQDDKIPEASSQALAYWVNGWLHEGEKYCTQEELDFTLSMCSVFFRDDLEKYIIAVISTGGGRDIVPSIFDNNEFRKFSNKCKLYFLIWAIFNDRCELVQEVLLEVLEKGLDYIEQDETHQPSGTNTNFLATVLIAFVLSTYDSLDVEDIDQFIKKALWKARGYEIKRDDRGYFAGHNLLVASMQFGSIYRCICVEGPSCISENSISALIGVIFDERDSIGNAMIDGKYAQRFLLKAMISIQGLLTPEQRITTEEAVAQGALKHNKLTLTDIWWSYLASIRKADILSSIFDEWLGLDGGKSTWDGELSELHSAANTFIPLAKSLGWEDKIKRVNSLLDYARVGYVGHKDYALYTPLEWYEELTGLSEVWREETLRFLNISEYASRTGDNRAEAPIMGAVANAVGRNGPSAIHSYIKTIFDGSLDNATYAVSSIISGLEKCSITVDDMLLLWETIIDVLKLNHSMPQYNSENTRKAIAIEDLRIALIERAEIDGIPELAEHLQRLAPFEYTIKTGSERTVFIIPDRWFDARHKNCFDDYPEIDTKSAFTIVLDALHDDHNDHTSKVRDFFDKLISWKVEPQHYAELILSDILERRQNYSWDYDGSQHLIRIIFPYLNLECRNTLIREMVNHYEKYRSYSQWDLHALNSDIFDHIFWYCKGFTVEQRSQVLHTMLDMQEAWITASGMKAYEKKYITIVDVDQHATWETLCKQMKTLYRSL